MRINARGTCCSLGVQGSTSNGGSSDLVKYDWVYFRRVSISLWQCGRRDRLGMGLDLRMSKADFCTWSPRSTLRTPPSLTLLRDNCMAAHICPGTSAWRIGKRIYSLPFLEGLNLGKPDCRNDLHQGGLQCHHSSRWVIFSPGKPSGPCLEGRKGFCKRRIGKTEPAFSAIASIADPPAYARNNLLNSATKPLPAFPRGKLFFYQ